MTAYVLVRITTDEPARLKVYQNAVPPILEKFGGRFLVRGGAVATLEGPEEARRIVVLEFPSLDLAKQFYYSEEYTGAIALRSGIAEFEMIAVDGVN